MTDYEADLAQRVEKSMKGTEGAAELLFSMFAGSRREGRISIQDLKCSLSAYRGLIKSIALLEVYCENFPNPGVKAVKEHLEPVLEGTEVLMNEMIQTLAEKAGLK